MQRTLILFVAVLVLGAVAWYATSSSGVDKKPANDRAFAYPETADIHRIFIADRQGHQTTLTRGGETGWIYNEEYPANENVIKNLMQAISQVEVQSLPTSKAIPNMVRNLATGGILVQLFDKNGDKLRGYYVGGGANGERGTMAIMENSDNPYIVHLPHWTGNLRFRFNLQDDEWRSKEVFHVDPDRVESLSIEYPTQRNQGFKLVRQGKDRYTVAPFYETGQPAKQVPRGIAEGVLSRFESYYVSRYENKDTETIAEARELLPFAIIRLKEEGQDEQVMKVYPRFRDPSYTNDPDTGETINFEQLRAYAAFLNDDRDWALLAVETTQPLLVSYDSF